MMIKMRFVYTTAAVAMTFLADYSIGHGKVYLYLLIAVLVQLIIEGAYFEGKFDQRQSNLQRSLSDRET